MKKILLPICTMLGALSLITTAQSVVPINGGTPTLVPVTINVSAGDQYYPHVSGERVAYGSDNSIRYYNFVNGADAEIPMGPSSRDLLSDISGNKVVFSRYISGVKTAVMVFDVSNPAAAPVELDPAPGTNRLMAAIGGNTVAFIDFSLDANGELLIYDLATSTSVRITNDVAIDEYPSVSPDGSIVTWDHCVSSSNDCDVLQAVKSGGGWNIGTVSATPSNEVNPDTNGTLVVYESDRNSNSDIFWRPPTGGPEVQLVLSSFDYNPSISGNYIAFESRATIGDPSDIFVYDVANNRLYQLTNTPLVTEQLNDIDVLPNGDLRLVWASDEDGSSARNIRGATFRLPVPTPCEGASTPAMLGSLLPRAPQSTLTQGGGLNNADTFVTPYVATRKGTITSWKAEFSGGVLLNDGVGVPSGIQLKIMRYSSANILEVVAAGAVHDPRPTLLARFGGSYPYFQEIDSVIEFTDAGLSVLSGDIIGLTIKSDPAVGGYFYPLVSPGGTRIVLRDAGVGETINLADPYTGALDWTPALQINLSNCSFNFLGFFQPVDNLPTLNVVTAGQAIPVKFSLDGNQGLDVFSPGYPASSQIACDASEPDAVIEETVTAGGSSLSYDAATDRYIYVWKTDKAWKGKCRLLNVRLSDGTDHLAKFRFR